LALSQVVLSRRFDTGAPPLSRGGILSAIPPKPGAASSPPPATTKARNTHRSINDKRVDTPKRATRNAHNAEAETQSATLGRSMNATPQGRNKREEKKQKKQGVILIG